MAENQIALEIFLEADKANLSLGELEQGYDALKEQIKATDRSTEEGRKAFAELSTQLAETGREVKNIELGFEALDNEQVASELGSVAGAVGDVTASMVLLGGENKTMEQMAASIEKAMAISMGFKGAIEGVSSGMKLYNNLLKTGKVQTIAYGVATKTAAVFQKALNVAMKANPIALVVTAILAAVAAYKLFTSETKEATFAQKAYNQASDEAAKATVKEKVELDRLVETAKNDNLSKSQRMKAIEELNKLSPEYLGNISIETINTKEASAAIDGYVDSLNKKARAQALENQLLEAHNELIDLERKAQEGNTSMLNSLIGTLGGVTAVQDIQNAQDQEAIRLQHEKIQSLTDLINKEEEAVQSHNLLNAAQKATIIDVDNLEKTVEANRKQRRENKLRDRSNDIELERIDVERDLTMKIEELDRHSIHVEGLKSVDRIWNEEKVRLHEEEMARIEAERVARLESANNTLENAQKLGGTLMDINNAVKDNAIGAIDAEYNRKKSQGKLTEAQEFQYAKRRDSILKAHFEREKKMNIAMAVINGAQAQMTILAQTPKADFGVATAIAMAAAAATTVAQIAAIKKQKFQGSAQLPPPSDLSGAASSASSGGGGAQINPVSNTSTILGDQNVTVVETDITNTQNNVNVIEESATF